MTNRTKIDLNETVELVSINLICCKDTFPLRHDLPLLYSTISSVKILVKYTKSE